MPPAETTTWRPARSSGGRRRRRGRAPRGTTVEDLGGLGQPALAGVGAGEPALGRLDDEGAARAQGRDVGPGGGVLPHLGVHRRREHHRAAGGEQRVGEQVVGQAVRGLGQQVGGGRARRRPGRRSGRSARAAPRARRPTPRWRPACRTAPPRWARRRTRSAAAVGTTVTSWPDSVKRRSSSQALYAAMPPLTPEDDARPRPGRGTASSRSVMLISAVTRGRVGVDGGGRGGRLLGGQLGGVDVLAGQQVRR